MSESEEKGLVKVARTSEVAEGNILSVGVAGRYVAICRFDGDYYAFDDQCTHECYPLSGGTQNGKVVTCMLHGAMFDVTTGAVLGPPAYEDVRTYPVRIEGNDILIAI